MQPTTEQRRPEPLTPRLEPATRAIERLRLRVTGAGGEAPAGCGPVDPDVVAALTSLHEVVSDLARQKWSAS